jgi:hypothetical protein
VKRTLPLLLLAALLSACASSSAQTRQSRRPDISVKAVAAGREHAAVRKADRLLAQIRLPAGARSSSTTPAALRTSNLGVSVITEFAYRHRVWKVREPLAAVTSFVRRHALPGFENHTGGESPVWLGYDQRLSGGRPMQRMYDVSLVRQGSWTFVRVDAAAAWIYPRSPREVVPAGVREIDIRGGGVVRRVTAPAQVARIVRWFDALHVTPPGVTVGCMLELSTPVHFRFRTASGAELARAVVPSEGADGCNSIQLTIGGKQQMPLGDARFGKHAFVEKVQRLLGVCFRDPRRACR